MAKKKKDGWFFSKSIIDEINSQPAEEIEGTTDESPAILEWQEKVRVEKEKLKALRKEYDTLKGNSVEDRQRMDDAIIHLREQNKALQKNIDALEAEKAELMKEHPGEEALKSQLELLIKENKEQKAEIKAIEEKYNDAIHKLEKEVQILRAETEGAGAAESVALIEELRAENEQMKQQLTEQPATGVDAESTSLIAELKAENQQIKQQLADEKATKSTDNNDEYVALIADLQGENERIKQQLTSQAAQASAGDEVAALKAELAQLTEKNQALEERAQKVEVSASEAQSHLYAEAQNVIAELKVKDAAASRRITELEAAEKERQGLVTQIEILNQELIRAKDSLTAATKSVQAVPVTIPLEDSVAVQPVATNAAETGQIAKLEAEKAALEKDISEERQALSMELFHAHEQVTKLQEQLSKTEGNQKELQEKVTLLEKDVAEKAAALEKLAELEGKVAQVTALEAAQSHNQEQLTVLNETLQAQVAEVAAKEEKIRELTQSLMEKDQSTEGQNAKIAALEFTQSQSQEQLTVLNETLQAQVNEVAVKEEKIKELTQNLAEKEQSFAAFKVEIEALHANEANELARTKQTVVELTERNQKLEQDVIAAQKEIGEVLISARKQANRTIQEAQEEARNLVSAAEAELENISQRATRLLSEVDASKTDILAIYDELQSNVGQLVQGSRLNGTKS